MLLPNNKDGKEVTGCPLQGKIRENREFCEKNSMQGKIREFGKNG